MPTRPSHLSPRTWLLSLVLFSLLAFTFAAFAEEGASGVAPESGKPSTAGEDADSTLSSGKVDERGSSGPALGLEGYGTISWTGLNGGAELGAGANVTLGIVRNLAIVGFGESDDTQDIFVDRFGAGLRYTAKLGTKVSLDGGVGGGYDQEAQNFFVRLPLGANFYAIKTKNTDVGLRVQYGFDIDGDGKHGTATGRFSFGPVLNHRF